MEHVLEVGVEKIQKSENKNHPNVGANAGLNPWSISTKKQGYLLYT